MIQFTRYTIQSRAWILFLGSCFLGLNSNAQSLDKYIEKAQRNDPKIEGLRARYEMASEKVNEVNSLPNTQFGAGYFASKPETRTGPQRAKLSITQAIPWFGTIKAKENYQQAVSEASAAEIEIAEQKLALTISASYYQLYAFKVKEKVIDQNIELLKTYEKLALNAVQVGNASAVDVLRLQVRQNELNEQKAVLQGNYFSEESKLNILLNQDKGQALLIPDSLVLEEEEPILAIDELKHHPELEKYDRLTASVNQAEKLNTKEGNPSLAFGVDYVAVSERPDMNFSDNGKDIVMPMVSVSIPIFNNKYKSVSRQNEWEKKAIQAEKKQTRNDLETTLQKAIQKRISDRISYKTQQKNLKQTEDAQSILRKQYESGSVDYTDILDIQELQLKFQLQQIESVNDYYQQTAIINYLSQ